MQTAIRKFITRSRSGLLGFVFVCSVSVGALTGFAGATANAASNPKCDQSNIVFCGLDQRSAQTSTVSLQKIYQANVDDTHHDIQTVFQWAGASSAEVAGMNTSNTNLGTLYRNGDIKVGSQVVGHDAWVAARFTKGQGFVSVSNGVWARKTTTSFAQASTPVLVHFQGSTADWAVMTNCGNPVKFTPAQQPQPKPQPKPQQAALTCDSLSATSKDSTGSSESGQSSEGENGKVYNFEAQATARHTQITKYVYAFGDGSQDTIGLNFSSDHSSTSHLYEGAGRTFTARVTVFSADFASGVTSPACSVTIKTPGAVLGATTATPATPAQPAPTTALPSTGGNDAAIGVGAFGAAAITGTLGYRFLARRKLHI